MLNDHELSAVAVFKGVLKPEAFIENFPSNFLARMFASFSKLQPYQQVFQDLKAIANPTRGDINRLWEIIYRIDNDFAEINTYDGFKEVVKKSESFTDFCLHREPDFQLMLIEHLAT